MSGEFMLIYFLVASSFYVPSVSMLPSVEACQKFAEDLYKGGVITSSFGCLSKDKKQMLLPPHTQMSDPPHFPLLNEALNDGFIRQ